MKNIPYYYIDGSNNKYIIQTDSLEYVPIRPEQSSTGMYSGGEPAKKALKPEDYQKILLEFDKIFANTELHIEDRIKTSGVLDLGNKKTVIFKDGKEKQQLEALLKQLLQ
ncbi:MAG: hypothetical protein MUE85_21340 [Microscillaceae bacterium]|jgi:hypothetical protein|nr:hypothetical protein [Microscillaceae bacterium]